MGLVGIVGIAEPTLRNGAGVAVVLVKGWPAITRIMRGACRAEQV
jgi:hypothetical protein